MARSRKQFRPAPRQDDDALPDVVLPGEEISGAKMAEQLQRRVWNRMDGTRERRVQVYIDVKLGERMDRAVKKMNTTGSAFMEKAIEELLTKMGM